MKRLLSAWSVSCFLLLIANQGWAEKWEYLGKHPLGKMYLDLDVVQREGEKVTYWGRRVYDQEQTSPDGKFRFIDQRVQHEINCKKQTVTYLGLKFLDQSGKVVFTPPYFYNGPNPIDPSGFIKKGEMLLWGKIAPESQPAGTAKSNLDSQPSGKKNSAASSSGGSKR